MFVLRRYPYRVLLHFTFHYIQSSPGFFLYSGDDRSRLGFGLVAVVNCEGDASHDIDDHDDASALLMIMLVAHILTHLCSESSPGSLVNNITYTNSWRYFHKIWYNSPIKTTDSLFIINLPK